MPDYTVPGIEVGSVVAVCPMHGLCQRFLSRRHCDEMNMTGHQWIGPKTDVMAFNSLAQQPLIRLIIVSLSEKLFAAVAWVSDVMWQSSHDHSIRFRHTPLRSSGKGNPTLICR